MTVVKFFLTTTLRRVKLVFESANLLFKAFGFGLKILDFAEISLINAGDVRHASDDAILFCDVSAYHQIIYANTTVFGGQF